MTQIYVVDGNKSIFGVYLSSSATFLDAITQFKRALPKVHVGLIISYLLHQERHRFHEKKAFDFVADAAVAQNFGNDKTSNQLLRCLPQILEKVGFDQFKSCWMEFLSHHGEYVLPEILVKLCIKNGVYGRNSVGAAIDLNYLQLLKTILLLVSKDKLQIDQKLGNPDGFAGGNALEFAVCKNFTGAVSSLLLAGATARTINSKSMLLTTISNGNHNIFKDLIDYGIDNGEIFNRHSKYALSVAVDECLQKGKGANLVKIVQYCLPHPFPINTQNIINCVRSNSTRAFSWCHKHYVSDPEAFFLELVSQSDIMRNYFHPDKEKSDNLVRMLKLALRPCRDVYSVKKNMMSPRDYLLKEGLENLWKEVTGSNNSNNRSRARKRKFTEI